MEVRLSGREMALETSGDDEDGYAPIAYLSDEGRQEPSSVLERRSYDHLQGAGLADALQELDPRSRRIVQRSEEHTSELQSLMRSSYAVFCLKKNTHKNDKSIKQHTKRN